MIDLLRIIKLVPISKWGDFFARDCFDYIGLAIYAIFGGAYLSKRIILQAGSRLGGVLLPLSILLQVWHSALKKGYRKNSNAVDTGYLASPKNTIECKASLHMTCGRRNK